MSAHGTMENNSVDKTIVDFGKAIHSSLSFSDAQKLKATMNIPGVEPDDNEIVPLALQYLLQRLFRLDFPAVEMRQVSEGMPVNFSEKEPAGNLPPRAISIRLDTTPGKIIIAGVSPQHGKDAFSELHFQWQQQAGVEDEHGNINFQNINTYPTIPINALVATINERTHGSPGVNAMGKIIKPRAGMPLRLEFDPKTIVRRDDKRVAGRFYLYSRIAGIVDFHLLLRNNPNTMNRVKIIDTITITGDIDYSVGDISDDCLGNGAVNIIVKGDVCGAFCLRSKGCIMVKGTVEGQRIEAKNIQINTINAGSEAVADNHIIVGTMIKARIQGRLVTVKRGASSSEIIGKNQVKLAKGSNILALTIRTRQLFADSNNFSGRTIVTLGQELFKREQKILRECQVSTKLGRQDLKKVTELGRHAVATFMQLEDFTKGAFAVVPKECARCLVAIKKELCRSLHAMNRPLPPQLFNQCYILDDFWANKRSAVRALAKIKALVNSLKILHNGLLEHCAITTSIAAGEAAIRNLRQEATELWVSFESPNFITDTSEVVINCGNQQMVLAGDNLPDESSFQVSYELSGETGISDGVLGLDSAF